MGRLYIPGRLERRLDPGREVREFAAPLELRADAGADGRLTFEGYASVFSVEYPMYGGPPYGWVERIHPTAFDETLAEDPAVLFLVNHGGEPIATTRAGDLVLVADTTGLRVRAHLDPEDPDVARIAVKMRNGHLYEMSFAFRTRSHEWDLDDARRTITGVDLDHGDVSLVNFGANPDTSSNLRALERSAQRRALAATIGAIGR